MDMQSVYERLNTRAQARFRGAPATGLAHAFDHALACGAAIATDASAGYSAVALSQNIARTPEGYLIARDAVLGRTGKMPYLVSQLKREQLQDLGLANRYEANDVVDIWREPEEVFSKTTLASFEGKPVTDDHPNGFVTVDNHATHHRGHVQNVRAGDRALPGGDLPLIGDILITDRALGDAILNRKKRELSCGYNYHLAYDGERLSQVAITGNHVAVVTKGRAGASARINDSAIDEPVDSDPVARMNARALAAHSQISPRKGYR